MSVCVFLTSYQLTLLSATDQGAHAAGLLRGPVVESAVGRKEGGRGGRGRWPGAEECTEH